MRETPSFEVDAVYDWMTMLTAHIAHINDRRNAKKKKEQT